MIQFVLGSMFGATTGILAMAILIAGKEDA